MKNVKKGLSVDRIEILGTLSKYVNELVEVLDNQIIDYQGWLNSYSAYIYLKMFPIKDTQVELIVNRLGKSLVDADVSCLYDAQVENLEEFKSEIKEELGKSKKLESK